MDRQSGRSTLQIVGASRNAVYIVPSPETRSYFRALARQHGRDDLRIETPCSYIEARRWRGDQSEVVIDHAVCLTPRQWDRHQEMIDCHRRRDARHAPA